MDRFSFGNLIDSIIIPEGTPTEEMVKAVLPIREAIAEMMPLAYKNRPMSKLKRDIMEQIEKAEGLKFFE